MRIILLLTFLLTSCTKDFILEEKATTITNEDYYSALAEGYKELAQREREEFDWAATEYFAQKGLDALKQNLLIPESPYNREITNKLTLEELQIAHKSLINLLLAQDLQIKYKFPLRAARLQILYDYWLEQAEEDWQREEINRFRDEFWASYESLVAIAKLAQIKELEAVKSRNYFTLYFPKQNMIFNNEAIKELKNFQYRITHTLNDYNLVLENFTILADNETNQKILENRLDKIKKAIFRAGISPKKIYSEKNIFIEKPSQSQEIRLYRDRVEIYIIDKKH